MNRRNYSRRLEFVDAAFRACWRNAGDLVRGSRLLLDNSLHALALSSSVLALEELGKLLCADGLLFASTDDAKTEAHAKSLRSHSAKSSALEVFPMLLGRIASVDPRFRTEQRFAQALEIGLTDLKERGNVVLGLLKDGSFHGLDKWKQAGFYSRAEGSAFVSPAESVTPEVAEAVYMLAWRAESTLDFLLKDGNLERYISSARALRSKLSEEEHQALEAQARRISELLFDGELDHDERRGDV